MNLPGYTANASLYKTNDRYDSATESDYSGEVVYPAQSSINGIVLRPCVRYKCIPYIDLYGHATVRCSWVWVC
jgi:hypothetical protein